MRLPPTPRRPQSRHELLPVRGVRGPEFSGAALNFTSEFPLLLVTSFVAILATFVSVKMPCFIFVITISLGLGC